VTLPGETIENLVSVVIPARNEEHYIGACLDSIRAQEHELLQVIVVDGASTDDTVAVVDKHTAEDNRVELLHNPRRTIPVSMNMGLAHARGRWLVRVDAHSVVPPTYVGMALRRLQEGSWGGVGGRKDGVGVTSAGRAIAAAMGSRFGVGNSTYHHGTSPQEVDHIPFGAYPVALLRSLHGWDEGLVANEDYELDYRLRQAGSRLLFDPQIAIRWHCRQSIGDLYRQYRRYGQGKVDVALLHPASLSVRHLVPPALVAYVGVAALAAAVKRSPVLPLGMLAPYGLAVGAATASVGRTLGSSSERKWVAPAFVAMHVGWGLGFWTGLAQTAARRVRGGQHR